MCYLVFFLMNILHSFIKSSVSPPNFLFTIQLLLSFSAIRGAKSSCFHSPLQPSHLHVLLFSLDLTTPGIYFPVIGDVCWREGKAGKTHIFLLMDYRTNFLYLASTKSWRDPEMMFLSYSQHTLGLNIK